MGLDRSKHRKLCTRWDLPGSAHYLTFSCLDRRPLLRSPRSAAWFFEAVGQAKGKCPFDLWAYVVMPEHVHLVVRPHDGVPVRSILYQIKKPVTTWAIAWAHRHDESSLRWMEDRRPDGRLVRRFWLRGGGYDRNLR
ncbi:MAG: transposase, partial [Planctomycetes bacterium]|nr:transposase [Planctomycetota bacterium]